MGGFCIRAIEAENFRQFREPVRIEGLDSGLNVIAGSNEIGKSTLLEAMQRVLFDRSSGTVRNKYKPLQMEGGMPVVAMEFELDGVPYRLRKVFKAQNGVTELDNRKTGEQWRGREAEQRLGELLGFSGPSHGLTKPEQQGAFGLLWVSQGSAWESVGLEGDARDRIYSGFEQEMQAMLGGGVGDRLLQRVASQRAEYFGKNDTPVREYKKTGDELQEKTSQLEVVQRDLEAIGRKVDRLAKVREELDRFERECTLEQAREKLTTARQRLTDIENLKTALRDVETRLKEAETGHKLAGERIERREALRKELASAREAATQARAEAQALEAALVPRHAALEHARAELRQAEHHRERCEAALKQARRMDRVRNLRDELGQLEAQLARATEQVERREALLAERATLGVDDEMLESLRKTQHDLERLQFRLGSAATRIDWELQSANGVTLDGASLPEPTGNRLLTAETRLEIAGVGHFVITPGGENLADLRAELSRAEGSLGQALESLGVSSLEQAEAQHRRRRDLDAELKGVEETLKHLAPDGIEALRARQIELQGELQRLGADASDEAETVGVTLAEREEALETARAECERLQRAMAQDEAARQELALQLAKAQSAANAAERRATQVEETLRQAREEADDERLQSALKEAERALSRIRAEKETATDHLQSAHPEEAELEVERREKALTELKRQRDALAEEQTRLQGELDGLGREGLAERKQALQGEIEALELRHRMMDRRARALDLLHRTLEARHREVAEAFLRPVVERMRPWLQRLIPGAEPWLGDDLTLKGLCRNGIEEEFDILSIGTREQLAILIRLAYADLLTEAGQPAMVVLDDALVYADDTRREVMSAILYEAARRFQILLLTCHANLWQDCGGKLCRLDDSSGSL